MPERVNWSLLYNIYYEFAKYWFPSSKLSSIHLQSLYRCFLPTTNKIIWPLYGILLLLFVRTRCWSGVPSVLKTVVTCWNPVAQYYIMFYTSSKNISLKILNIYMHNHKGYSQSV